MKKLLEDLDLGFALFWKVFVSHIQTARCVWLTSFWTGTKESRVGPFPKSGTDELSLFRIGSGNENPRQDFRPAGGFLPVDTGRWRQVL